MATILLLPFQVEAGPDSAWTEGFHSRVRLVSGGIDRGRRLAGVEIKLDPGFKTYWRNPGEAGLPPRFDWTASRNVAAVELEWPAPERMEDAGGVSYGFHDRVLIPVRVAVKDPARPVTLAVTVDYGVCKEICIPAHAELSLPLSDTATHPLIQAALDRVPAPQALGAPDGLAVLAVEPVAGDRATFAVSVRSTGGADPALFAEAPDGWYLSTSAAQPGGRFLITIDEKPKDATGSVPVRLTLTAGGRAVETDIRLDASSRPR